ncbi:Serine/threonine-protein kinase pkn1 [Polystyrenella longa]|uniref:Serine/threonine-protein kinase pkn1 n=1 Tax=Polystyrenella longa TaxID=2528007 RepID=A0A518CNF4_9PLAN|nr:SUMF1/EgtB/PvdO family nonheme iron enzyme [Polystyrenella longa]QDU80724.1 Serine/threonine-protein kinase pkn1 [Polystyrenella longa]
MSEESSTTWNFRWSIKEWILLIVIGNILFLVGVPALARLQEMSRLQTCEYNLSQLGVALESYHDTHRVYPPAAHWGSEGLDLPNLLSHEFPTKVEVTRDNWVQMLLPYLGDGDSFSFRSDLPTIAPENAAARESEFPALSCPSDTYNRPDNQYELETPDGSLVYFARGNYAINGGSEYVPAEFGTLSNPGPTENRYVYDEGTREFQWWGNGLAGINKSFSRSDIVNGASTFVALEEIRAGLDPIDPRGVWALGQIGGSITWGHGVVGDDGGPNYVESDSGEDDILGAPALYKKLGAEFIDGKKMGACDYCNENAQATARSMHSGGVNAMLLDGSVRFVSDTVEKTLWHVMHSREAPEAIFNSETFEDELAGLYEPGEAESAVSVSQASAPSEVEPASVYIENSIGMKFVAVPDGEFLMGLPNKGNEFPYPDDAVPHKVRLTHPFYLGLHEVTQEQFEQIAGNNPSAHSGTGEYRERVTLEDTSECPVENVSWDDAVRFCNLLSALPEEKKYGRVYRLPTESEWEWACRAADTEEIEQHAEWIKTNETGEIGSRDNKLADQITTVPVGTYPANRFGVYDMTGNVFEWVSDYRRRDYYANSPVDNPRGPATGYLHVIRGWYWVATGPYCKVYVANDPWKGSPFIGFRIVCDLTANKNGYVDITRK